MEVIQSLRRTDFPEDTRGALKHLERVCVSQNEASVCIPGLSAEVQRNEIPPDFLDEFIFHQLDWQGNRRHLTAIQELQLLDILSTVFQDCKNPTLFRLVFFRLFPLDLPPMSYRTIVLCKSVSLSIAANSASFLTCAAEWLSQDLLANSQDGAHLPGLSNAVATTIVQDYCLLQSATPKGVVNLSSTSPEFACFFVRAITQMFDMKGSPQYSYGSPPSSLLGVIADWLTENPALLRTPVALPPNTPPQRKQALLTAPLLGLVRWCVKAPLIEVACSKMLKRLADEDASSSASSKNASVIASATTQLTLTAVYSKLHLAVLNCFMMQLEETQQQKAPPSRGAVAGGGASKPTMEPFSINQILQLAQELTTLERQVRLESTITTTTPFRSSSQTPPDGVAVAAVAEESMAMGICMDRLAQAIQVAKATNSLMTQPGDLTRLEQFLPNNPLLRVVVAHWDPPRR